MGISVVLARAEAMRACTLNSLPVATVGCSVIGYQGGRHHPDETVSTPERRSLSYWLLTTASCDQVSLNWHMAGKESTDMFSCILLHVSDKHHCQGMITSDIAMHTLFEGT